VALSAAAENILRDHPSAVAIFATAFGVLDTGMQRGSQRVAIMHSSPMFVGFCRRLSQRMYPRMTAAVIDRSIAGPPRLKQENIMSKSRTLGAAVAAAVLSTAALAAAPANAAVVYCKTAGVPQGCVARATPVVVAPVVRPAPVAVGHVGYTRVTPYGVRHVGATRVVR
jgi:hypothetical protein